MQWGEEASKMGTNVERVPQGNNFTTTPLPEEVKHVVPKDILRIFGPWGKQWSHNVKVSICDKQLYSPPHMHASQKRRSTKVLMQSNRRQKGRERGVCPGFGLVSLRTRSTKQGVSTGNCLKKRELLYP